MPRLASEITKSQYLRLLILGGGKVGKSTTTLLTCDGPSYVINSDQESALVAAAAQTTEFEWDLVETCQEMEKAIMTARKGVKEGKYKTVIWDTITNWQRKVLPELEAASAGQSGLADGRKYWGALKKHLLNYTERLLALPCHVIVIGHHAEVSAEIDGQISKEGDTVGGGVVPCIEGGARTMLPTLFDDIVYFEKKGGERYFLTSSAGVYGPGGRNLAGVHKAPANIKELWKIMQENKGVKVVT